MKKVIYVCDVCKKDIKGLLHNIELPKIHEQGFTHMVTLEVCTGCYNNYVDKMVATFGNLESEEN
jgi:hypothetical protein